MLSYARPVRLVMPLGRSVMTILLLFFGPLGPGFLVRVPFVPQPQGETGCLFDFDLPRPPPCGWSDLFRDDKSKRKRQEGRYLLVHCHTANRRSYSQPPRSPCLAKIPILMQPIADASNSGATIRQNLSNFPALQSYMRVPPCVLVIYNFPP